MEWDDDEKHHQRESARNIMLGIQKEDLENDERRNDYIEPRS